MLIHRGSQYSILPYAQLSVLAWGWWCEARFPCCYLPAVSDKTGWQDFKQKVAAVAFSEVCRLTVFLSACLHSFISDCPPALRAPTFSVTMYLKIVMWIWHVMESRNVARWDQERREPTNSLHKLCFLLWCLFCLFGASLSVTLAESLKQGYFDTF